MKKAILINGKCKVLGNYKFFTRIYFDLHQIDGKK